MLYMGCKVSSNVSNVLRTTVRFLGCTGQSDTTMSCWVKGSLRSWLGLITSWSPCLWSFPYMGVLQMDGLIWFIMEHPNLKWMILGYPYFGKPPCISTTNEAHHCQPPSAVFAHRVAQKACERRLLWAAVQSMSLLWQMIKFRELQAVIMQECLGVRALLNKWVIPSVIINGISPLISADPGLRQGRGGAWDHRRCGTFSVSGLSNA